MRERVREFFLQVEDEKKIGGGGGEGKVSLLFLFASRR